MLSKSILILITILCFVNSRLVFLGKHDYHTNNKNNHEDNHDTHSHDNHGDNENKGNHQNIEVYLLVLNWGSTFCIVEAQDKSYCENKISSLSHKNILRLHGLWPNTKQGEPNNEKNTSGVSYKYPSASIESDMKEFWPSFKSDNTKFWEHEYEKHGWLFNQMNQLSTPDEFFSKSLDLYRSFKADDLMSDIVSQHKGHDDVDISYDELMSTFSKKLGAGNFQINCQNYHGDQYFTDIRIHVGLNFNLKSGYRLEETCNQQKPIKVVFEK